MLKSHRLRMILAAGMGLLLASAGMAQGDGFSLPGLETKSLTAKNPEGPTLKVTLLADRTGIAPGGSVELALRLEIPDEWHIYWKNRGEGGLETKLEWSLPVGFKVGPARFPAPTRDVDEADAHTFIMSGEPVILATLTAPKEATAGQTANIEVKASWLACKKQCYSGKQTAKLDLPVVASADQAKPANEDEFRAAIKQLPVAADKAKHIQNLRAVANVDRATPGSKFMIGVVFEVQTGLHVNSHKPIEEELIPTDVFAELTEGVEIGRPMFPPGTVEAYHDQKLSLYRGKTIIALPVRADGDLSSKELRFAGVLTYQACSDKTGACYPPAAAEWSVVVPVAQAGQTVAQVNQEVFRGIGDKKETGGFTLSSQIRSTTLQEQHSLVVWLVLALLAGLILNVTPCVLPVISIKVLSFVQQASQSPARVFKLGLAFSLGMMVVFNMLALMATALGLVWGQHFQSPVFTIAMASIVFAFGLSMFGVYTLGVPQKVGKLAVKAEGEGYVGSIAKGALATVMGTPCLGPFLGPVLVWASGQTAPVVFLVFNTIGFGMALPYVALTAHPAWLRFVPKAGPWLTTFKQSMAFLLMGTVVYLLFILEGQLGGPAVVWTLVFLTVVALACWMIGRFITFNTPSPKRLFWLAVALAIVAASGYISFVGGFEFVSNNQSSPTSLPAVPSGHASRDAHASWIPFSMDKLTELTSKGKPVLLDITARWCPNCQVNSALVFNTPEMAAAIAKYDVVPMLADWTARDRVIGELIEKLAPGASIPLTAIFPAGRPNEPIVMLGLVTKQEVIDNLAKAGLPSK